MQNIISEFSILIYCVFFYIYIIFIFTKVKAMKILQNAFLCQDLSKVSLVCMEDSVGVNKSINPGIQKGVLREY